MIRKSQRAILVVDDQESWRNLLCELLEDDFDVKRASSYLEAREFVLRQKPPFHVVISDIRLVDLDSKNEDGLQLVKELNELSDQTKVIVITGYPSINTAKQALGKLAAYDYLEKRPSDGRSFDIFEFRRVVRQAADEAEQQRPGTLYIPQRILIIEPNAIWRGKLASILRSDGYRVDEMKDTALLFSQFNDQGQSYDLIIVDEAFLDRHFFDYQHNQPNAKIIVLTEQTFAVMLRKMQEHAALSAFSLRQDFNDDEFRKTVHRAFALEITKYVMVSIEGILEPETLHCGETYRLILSLSEFHHRNTMAVELAPKTIKGELLALRVFVYAPLMKFQNTEVFWKIPTKGRLTPLELEFVPEEIGQGVITIELEQDNRWLGRIEKRIDVRKPAIEGENNVS